MTVREIKYLIKEYDISFEEFQKNLGRFLFRVEPTGEINIMDIEVTNSISRIINERMLEPFKHRCIENSIDWDEYIKHYLEYATYDVITDHNGCRLTNVSNLEKVINAILSNTTHELKRHQKPFYVCVPHI